MAAPSGWEAVSSAQPERGRGAALLEGGGRAARLYNFWLGGGNARTCGGYGVVAGRNARSGPASGRTGGRRRGREGGHRPGRTAPRILLRQNQALLVPGGAAPVCRRRRAGAGGHGRASCASAADAAID